MKFGLTILLSIVSLLVKGQLLPTLSSNEIYIKLNQLKVCGSVLYIAAHPDDENNGLLPYLTKEKFYRTAYLSLTRGEGGQNLIGSEQGIALGLIRTKELLAARKIDGAEQYFTRAYEFGFSKTSDETLQIWDSLQVLDDIVWCIRKFKPDIIITRFPPDSRAGHGHHSASAILANIAFDVAADSSKFTHHFLYNVYPHQAKRIVWNTYNFGSLNTTNENQLKISFNSYNSLIGKSYGEIGAEARTMHKSQGEGRARRRGELFEYFNHTKGFKAEKDLMDNVDISWKKISPDNQIEALINELIKNFDFKFPEKSVKPLVEVYKQVNALPNSAWKNYKINQIKELIEICSGLFIEATTNQEYVVQGDSLKLNININNRLNSSVTINSFSINGFDTTIKNKLSTNKNYSLNKVLKISEDKEISQPYWLQQPATKGMFVVNNQLQIGEAETSPDFIVQFKINIEGVDFDFAKPVFYKYVDLVKGELYQPLYVLPQASAEVDNEQKIIINKNNTNGKISIKNYMPNIKLQLLDTGISLKLFPFKVEFSNTKTSKEIDYTLLVNKPNNFNAINFFTNNNQLINKTIHQIKYDHIPNINYYSYISITSKITNIVAKKHKVGYIIGAGDKVPEALLQLNYSVDILNDKDITSTNLKKYKAIVTGIRAYNTIEWLSKKNDIINEYIKQGGNLIIQYIRGNTYNSQKIEIGPYNFSVNAQNRITDENCEVRMNLPKHTSLNFPNKITSIDFENWVQERSTYQIEKADSNFVFPLQMNDENEKPTSGSLAIAKYGKGNVVYCSLALFRQLPAGVIGAYKIISNLIELPKN